MHAIVLGAGMVGQNLADALYREGYNVTLIDRSAPALERASESLDIQTIEGHGADADVLARAGVAGAEFFMAVTDVDEINLLASLVAKELGALLTVARVNERVYMGGRGSLFRNLMGVDIALSPDSLTAMEIARNARAAGVVAVENLTGGKLVLREVEVSGNRASVGRPLRELELPDGCLIPVLMRDHEAIVPSGDDLIRPGDRVFLLGLPRVMGDAVKLLGKESGTATRAIVVGGGSIGLLAAQSLADLRVDVRLVERDQERCRELSELITRGEVLHGDGTDVMVLREAGIEDIDLFVAAAGQDELNLVLGTLAGELGAKKKVVLVKRREFQPIVERLGIDVAISPRIKTAEAIMRYIRRRKFTNLALVGENKTEILDGVVTSASKVAGVPLKELDLPRETLVGAILRNDEVVIPRGDTVLEPADHVVVVAAADAVPELLKLF